MSLEFTEVHEPRANTSSNDAPTITIIIPNRNDAHYLPQCLQSVLQQDSPADEIIIIDDDSSDDSLSVIKSLIRSTPRARLIESHVNLGTIGALNEGLRVARSEYVLFLSSNDFLLSGLVARAKSCLHRTKNCGVWSAMVWVVDENNRKIRLQPSPVVSLRDAWFSPSQCLELAIRHGNWFTGTTLVFHRDTIVADNGLDPSYGGLSDLLAGLTVACRRGAAYSPEPLGVMRLHKGGFLAKTLAENSGLDQILGQIHEHGPRWVPQLFTAKFLRRLTHRFRFAALRSANGEMLEELATYYIGPRRTILGWIGRSIPVRFVKLRAALAFLVLRPFDVIPTLWYRLMLAKVVELRSCWPGIIGKEDDAARSGGR